MKKTILTLAVGLSMSLGQARADEGMWLMQQLSAQYKQMQERGLKLQERDIYDPSGSALQDAVVIFDQGCTGEVISQSGLILTNHHCGYDAIRALSSVEHNYLEDGFWAQSLSAELPTKGVSVTFIDAIEDVTSYVKRELSKIKDPNDMSYLSPKYLDGLAKKRAGKLPKGVEVEIKAFYNGNRYLMFTKKVYTDVRFVGAPPSSIGKFGADTDNWEYPRHAGDFSIFRVYTDPAGNPADYAPSNIPLKPKRWLNISTQGIQEGDFAMVIGFPGRTNRFYLPEEVDEWRSIDNDIRIRMSRIREEVMLREMLRDPAINIKYASKYATSQNRHKRAVGANWGIEKRNLTQAKRQQMQELLDKTTGAERTRYQEAIATITQAIAGRREMRTRQWYLNEGPLGSIDLYRAVRLVGQDEEAIRHFYTDEYDTEVDKRLAEAILSEYCQRVDKAHWPTAIASGVEQYGSVSAYVDKLYKSSYATAEGLLVLRSGKLPADQEADSLVVALERSLSLERLALSTALSQYDNPIDRARRTYVGGLLALHGDGALWPDANSTLRFTYGNVKGYIPRDGVRYLHQTWLDGVIQKEDPSRWEFVVSPRLKEIYQKQTYGQDNRYAVRTEAGWRMPVNFAATTHTTGGNSGSPVLDAQGRLIGINFDRNWEGVGGDIQYLPDYQRSIICDIRYILMVIEELGQCRRLIDEMTIQ